MASDVIARVPDFIRFLFSTKPKFDCHFVVGNKSQGKPERIGAVKLMLMAHSEVFRLQLEDSDLKEKGNVPVEDVHPDSFKGMLKYVYGHDTTPDMCFDEADNLLYVAEKYMIQTLKDKLAMRLMKLLNPDNLCSLLNNPVCYTHLELNSAITQILRYETDHVLASPQFLLMNAGGFLKILEQDGLAVPEIELWRAAMKWAKHRANSEDGQLLRQQISGLTKQMRLQTLTTEEIFEVIPSGFLNSEEVNAVVLSDRKRKREENAQGLNDFSYETVPRKGLLRSGLKKELEVSGSHWNLATEEEYEFNIETKQQAIELVSLVCRSENCDSTSHENHTSIVHCRTTITEVSMRSFSTIEPSITVPFIMMVKYNEEFEIPLAVDGENIILLPNTCYSVNMKFLGHHMMYCIKDTRFSRNDDMILETTGKKFNNQCYYGFPFNKVQYRVTTVENSKKKERTKPSLLRTFSPVI